MSNNYPGGIISLGGPIGNSNYFNGASSQYLTVPKNAALEPATSGAWTLETWVYVTSGTSGILQVIAYANPTVSSGPDLGYFITHYPGNYISGGFYSGGSSYAVSSAASFATIGSWQHVALVSTGTTMSLYVNGTSVGTPLTVTGVSINAPSSALFKIGSYNSNQYLYGYVSNTRFVKGTAVYTANFVPPTGPLQNISGTGLLTCQSPTIIDNSSNAFTITNTGGVAVSSYTPFTAYNPNELDPALGGATNGVYRLSDMYQAVSVRDLPMYDPYYRYVTLNLNGNGSNTANNHSFTDASTNNFPITRNGNATQGTFSPYLPSYSNHFYYSSSSYLTTASTTAMNLGTSDFCIEMWFYWTGAGNGYFGLCGSQTDYKGPALSLYNQKIMYGLSSNGSTWDVLAAESSVGAATVTAYKWHHIALCRTGSTITGFLDGVQDITLSSSASLVSRTEGFTIGAWYQGLYYWEGYISNVRFNVGSSPYNAASTTIDVPTAPLLASANTQLLTCQSSRFKDNSNNGFALTVGGTPQVQAFQPFLFNTPYESSRLGGSGYFDGTGDYLSFTTSSSLGLGTGEYTAECWVYASSAPAYSSFLQIDTGGLQFGVDPSGYIAVAQQNITFVVSSTTAVPLNTWSHIAVSRDGSSVTRIFLNGVQIASATDTTNFATGTTAYINHNSGNSAKVTGYIADMRVLKGTALYTAAFTPPTAPLTAVTNTSLLTNMTNAGIVDNTMMNNIETVGNAQISTDTKKYSTGSMYFDGTGDYLVMPNDLTGAFRTGDFTVEYWFKCGAQANPSYLTQVGTLSSGTVAASWRFGTNLNATAGVYFAYHNGTTYVDITFTTTNYNDNTWHHAACVRQNGTLSAYIDGIKVGSNYTVTYDFNSTNRVVVGTETVTPTYYTGYIDDLRITKGIARYTGNFQPPTSQLQNL